MEPSIAIAFVLIFALQSVGFIWLVDRLTARSYKETAEAKVEGVPHGFQELTPEGLPMDEPRIEEALTKAMPLNELLRKTGHGVSNDGDEDGMPPLREQMQKGNLTDMNDGLRERVS